MKRQDFSQCEAVLFDFGGTLDSDGEHWLDRFYELFEQVGFDLSRDDIKRAFYQADALCCSDPQVDSMGLRPLMNHHVRLQFTAMNLQNPAKEEEIVEHFCLKTERILKRNAMLLDRLKAVYRLGLVSNFYGNVATLCREAGFAELLEVLLDSTRIGVGKPDLEIFRIALGKLNLPPTKVIFVGDSFDRDIIPARQLGMKTVWMKGPNPRLPETFEPADYDISSLMELESILL
jgi:putative hydrolase of the HAD superfamily